MMKIPPALILLAALLPVCWAGCQKVSSHQDLEKIRQLEKEADESRETTAQGQKEVDREVLEKLGEAYVKFAEEYPQAPETPELLFRAGELYTNELQDHARAIELFEKNYREYPRHETAANALFFIGYLYNNALHDMVKAEKSYKEFLRKYPKHNMAPHAEFELKSLGMSLDEVFEKLILKDSTAIADSAAREETKH